MLPEEIPIPKHYVYLLLDTRKEKGIYSYKFNEETIEFEYPPFYVGKGFKNRYKSHFTESINVDLETTKRINKHKVHIIRQITSQNKEQISYLFKENLREKESFELEIELIKFFGRQDKGTGILVNMTDGGEGWTGALSQSIGKTYEEIYGVEKGNYLKEIRRGKNNGNFKNKSDGARIIKELGKIREGQSLETIYGKDKAQQIRLQQSIKNKGRIVSEETKQKLRDCNSGEKHYSNKPGFIHPNLGKETPESIKKKISETLKTSEISIRGKSYEEFFGTEKAEELRKVRSDGLKRQLNPVYTIYKIYNIEGIIIHECDTEKDFKLFKKLNKKEFKNYSIEKIKPNKKK